MYNINQWSEAAWKPLTGCIACNAAFFYSCDSLCVIECFDDGGLFALRFFMVTVSIFFVIGISLMSFCNAESWEKKCSPTTIIVLSQSSHLSYRSGILKCSGVLPWWITKSQKLRPQKTHHIWKNPSYESGLGFGLCLTSS